MAFIRRYFTVLLFTFLVTFSFSQADSLQQDSIQPTLDSNAIKMKITGVWKLTSYTQCLNCLQLEVSKLKSKKIKINNRKGIYYYEFLSDGTVFLCYVSKNTTRAINGNWKIEYDGKIHCDFSKAFLTLAPDGMYSPKKYFTLFQNSTDLEFLNDKLKGNETLYTTKPYGWSAYDKTDVIPVTY